MKVLVYPHSMEIGGSQINAVELAGAVRNRGHDVAVFGGPGPLRATVETLDLRVVEAPPVGRRPSPARALALVDAVRDGDFDLVHAYEWPPTLEATYGPHAWCSTPVVSTVLSMAVAPFLPRHLPLVVGTEQIRSACTATGRVRVHLIEPPVDTVDNAPRPRPEAFAARWRVAPGVPVVVVVSRLAHELKRTGLLEAMTAVAALPSSWGARLLVVGDGDARTELQQRAAAVNLGAGREVVTLTGALLDPRAAYALADVVLGMGSSILRGMAFAKAAVVQGEAGFWEAVTPESLPTFLRQGWYGHGGGGAVRLTGILAELLADRGRLVGLGSLSRDLVVSRFSLDRAAALQEQVYAGALTGGCTGGRTGALVRSFAGLVVYKARRRRDRSRGRAATDDFNALPPPPVVVGQLG